MLITNKLLSFFKFFFPDVQKLVKNAEQGLQIVEPQIHKKFEEQVRPLNTRNCFPENFIVIQRANYCVWKTNCGFYLAVYFLKLFT